MRILEFRILPRLVILVPCFSIFCDYKNLILGSFCSPAFTFCLLVLFSVAQAARPRIRNTTARIFCFFYAFIVCFPFFMDGNPEGRLCEY